MPLTPAEAAFKAADLFEERSRGASPARCWRRFGERRWVRFSGDAQWIALANPGLGPLLAGLLREQAERAARYRSETVQASLLGPEWLKIAYDAARVPQDERVDIEAIMAGEA